MKWFAVARPWLAVASVAAVLAGCSLAPEYQRPGQPVPDNYPQLTPATDDLTAPSAADLLGASFSKIRSCRRWWRWRWKTTAISGSPSTALKRHVPCLALPAASASSVGIGANAQVTRTPEDLRMAVRRLTVFRVYMAGAALAASNWIFGRIKT